jgi:uncharacterized protein (DUF362 family)
MLMITHPYTVRAVHCDHQASDEDIYAALQRAANPLENAWKKLRAARRIVIKFNQDWVNEPPHFQGHHRELVSKQAARAVLRLLRENTSADLLAADASFFQAYENAPLGSTATLRDLFREFAVEYVDANAAPIVPTQVPGGGLMFNTYFMPKRVLEADAVVSVQKMKNHAFMGISLCLKNLFGLMPTELNGGRPRLYYHHLVRMPYMLVDIGRIFNPVLNIIDGLTSTAGQEWGSQHPRISNTLLAGDHPITTDACAATLMGHDPHADWLTPPYHRDRNALLIASENGWGTTDLSKIDYHSEAVAPLGEYFAHITDSTERVINWRRTTAEQALIYRDRQREFIARYSGQYILLQQGQVRWHSKSGRLAVSRRVLSGDYPDEALWQKYVDPDEQEGENYEIYERTLKEIKNL